MRWEGQDVEREREARLPGVGEPSNIRTFDAPEAMGVRFHEVEARSALNRVPGNGLPFRWTVNPYRGCSHACTYCMDADTPILVGDGSKRPLREVRVGDSIYGTVKVGSYRRFVLTEVLAHWATRKPAYRVTLEDGTELIASGDHRFLSDRGWKYVSGAEQGRLRRPHLTESNNLLGVGALAPFAGETEGYRRGYLAGMIRGDGHVGAYGDTRPHRRSSLHRFRLALADIEALDRTRSFLADLGVRTTNFAFTAESDGHRPLTAIRTQSRDGVERIRELIAWPTSPEPGWTAGFLAGIFDAEGSYSSGTLRITNTDEEILRRTSDSLAAIGIPCTRERGEGRAGAIRVLEGLPKHLELFHRTNPAITRKRSIVGTAIRGKARLRVVSIEPLPGPQRLFDITTGTGDFIANGVVSHNCFARPTHRYLDLNAGEDFEREIVVKVNVPERLRAELRRPSWKGEAIALGTNTDPYQWVEGRYRLTRSIWEVMLEARNPSSVLTKSPLLLRDIDLFKQLVEKAGFAASLSIPTIDEPAWRASEPRTPHPRKRIEAVAELNRAGVPAGVLVAPLMPGINDSPRQVEEILALCGEAGATSVGGIGLHLKGEVRDVFLDWLRSYRPDLRERYEELYSRGAFLPRPERERLTRMVAQGRKRAGISSQPFRVPRSPVEMREEEKRAAEEAREVPTPQPRLF